MTQYAGEVYLLTVNADDFDEESIEPDEIDSMVVEIRKGSTVIVTETPMTWDAEREWWGYRWDTAVDDIQAGSYKAKVTLIDLEDGRSFEYKPIRLKRKAF